MLISVTLRDEHLPVDMKKLLEETKTILDYNDPSFAHVSLGSAYFLLLLPKT